MKYLIIVLIILCVFIIYSQRSQTPLVVVEATPTPTPIPVATPKPIPTPNPAVGAMKAAVEMYPALKQRGSEFNLMFVDLYQYTQENNPQALVSPNWPLDLSGQIANKLGVNPATIGATPTPPVVVVAAPSPTPVPLDDPSNPLNQGAYNKTSHGPYWYNGGWHSVP